MKTHNIKNNSLLFLLFFSFSFFRPLFSASSSFDPHLSQMEIPHAWSIAHKSQKKVIIAIIDTGIESEHPSLSKHLWHDPENNHVFGWDFVTHQENPTDDNGHGTHISGIIEEVDPTVVLMPIKYYSAQDDGEINLIHTVSAIHYAIEHGAQIINYSGGGRIFSQEEQEAILEAGQKGILFVTAAGNESENIDIDNSYFPASYHLSNMITVAGLNDDNTLLKESNWGKRKVDVAAPAKNIISTFPHHTFKKMSGTSQATAFVSGIAGLLLSQNKKLRPEDIKDILLKTVDPLENLQSVISSGGKINAYQALKEAQLR